MFKHLDAACLRPSSLARRWRGSLGAGLAALMLGLAACGGGDTAPTTATDVGSADPSDTGAMPVLKFPKQGYARLGTLKDATVEVYDLHSDIPIYETKTDAQGHFDIDLGSHPLDAFYKVQVRGGTDVDFNDSGAAGQTPVENTATLTALATGQQIADHGVSVTVLSDSLARQVDEAIAWSPAALVQRELNEAAGHLLSHDIDGDGLIDYRDVLAFNPQLASHKSHLRLDYSAFFLKNSQGLSVMDMYHANHPALADALSAMVGDAMDIHLPDADQATLASLSFGVDGHGSLSADLLPAALDHNGGRYAVAVDKSASARITVRARAAAGSTLLAWEGCEQDASDPLLCRVTPDTTKSVLAIFQDPDKAAADTSVLHLSSASTPVGFVMHESEAVITAVKTDPIVAKLDAELARVAASPSHRFYVGSDLAKQATVQVKSLLSRSEVEGVVRYVVTYAGALVTDALESGSAYAPPAAISVDTISSLSYAGADNTTRTVAPQGQANADYLPGPNPVDTALDSALCGSQKSQHVLADDRVACIAGSNLPVQSATGLTHSCAANQTLVETLDGEEFCVDPADIHLRAEVTALRAKTPGSGSLSFARAQTGLMSVQALQQAVRTSAAPVAFQPGEVVWLVGHGKAIHLSHNVFMVDRADGRGVRMLTADGAITSVAEGSRAPMAYQQCSRDGGAPECGFFSSTGRKTALSARGQSTAQAALLPEIEFTITPEKYRWVTFSFKVNVDLVGQASASFDWGVLWYAFNSRGKIEVAPSFNTSVTADGLALFKKPTPSSPPTEREEVSEVAKLQSGEPVFERDIFKIDFLQKIPGAASVSPVLESALRFAIGVDAAGQAKIEIETSYRHVVAWDVRSEFTYYAFQANHNHQSFKVANRGYPGVAIKVDANGSMGLYTKAAVSMGPRGIMPELATLQARYYLYKLEAMGKLLLSYQTDPVKVAEQHGQNFCWAGAVSLTLKRSFDVTASINLRPTGALGKITEYVPLPKWDWTLYSWDGVILNVGSKRGSIVNEAVFGADVDLLGASNGGTDAVLTDTSSLECPAPSPANMPAERVYPGQNFKLESGHSVYTKTHEFTMQTDGNFIIYQWNGERGPAVWSSNTKGKAAVEGYNKLAMGVDGHLVMTDILGNGFWGTAVYGIGANTVKLSASGALEVWSQNAMLWSSATGLNRGLPQSLSFAPGGLTLRPNEAVTSLYRSLHMNSEGGLVLRRLLDNRYLSPAWWTGIAAGDKSQLVFQSDGNLVLFNNAGAAIWSSGTAGKGATALSIDVSGRMAIYRGSTALWATPS